MREIIWSDDAKSDYDNNILFLLEKWTVADAQQFVDEVAVVLRNLPSMPDMFPATEYNQLHKAVICRQITMLYTVTPSTIELVRFWNNHQNQDKLKPVK